MFTLPDFPYPHNALEPHIDKETMMIHHGKHHQGYVTKLNDAIKGTKIEKEKIPLEEVMCCVSKYNAGVRNNGGGHYNHSLFWKILSPKGGGTPSGDLATAINDCFGSFEKFKEEFANAAATRFGSGWAWLCLDAKNSLFVTSTPNQDNPLMDVAEKPGIPILGLDVWEHAYYLKYQNKRPDYIAAFWKIVNWKEVEKNYAQAQEKRKVCVC